MIVGGPWVRLYYGRLYAMPINQPKGARLIFVLLVCILMTFEYGLEKRKV